MTEHLNELAELKADKRDNEQAAKKLGWNGLPDGHPDAHGDAVDWMRREIIQLRERFKEPRPRRRGDEAPAQ